MKFLISFLAFAIWGSRFAAAEWDGDEAEVNQLFQQGAEMTLLCPDLETISCFNDSIGQQIFSQMGLLMEKKFAKEMSNCDDRRARRLRGMPTEERNLMCGQIQCPEDGPICALYGCRRTLKEENDHARLLDGDEAVRGTKSGNLKNALFAEFPGQFALNQNHYNCMAGLVCTMEWTLTNCDD